MLRMLCWFMTLAVVLLLDFPVKARAQTEIAPMDTQLEAAIPADLTLPGWQRFPRGFHSETHASDGSISQQSYFAVWRDAADSYMNVEVNVLAGADESAADFDRAAQMLSTRGASSTRFDEPESQVLLWFAPSSSARQGLEAGFRNMRLSVSVGLTVGESGPAPTTGDRLVADDALVQFGKQVLAGMSDMLSGTPTIDWEDLADDLPCPWLSLIEQADAPPGWAEARWERTTGGKGDEVLSATRVFRRDSATLGNNIDVFDTEAAATGFMAIGGPAETLWRHEPIGPDSVESVGYLIRQASPLFVARVRVGTVVSSIEIQGPQGVTSESELVKLADAAERKLQAIP